MNKEEFIKMYVASFLGAWANTITWEGRPNWQRIVCNPPIEDAIFQAEETWKRGKEVAPEVFNEYTSLL